MTMDTLARGLIIAQCLEAIEQAEATLDALMNPQTEEPVCPTCQAENEAVYKWLSSN